MVKTLGALAAAMALAVAPAQAACWNTDEAAAATVRELQTVLMVSALRCQVVKIDITADYNDFLRANKVTIQQMNDRIKAHFIKAAGPVQGQTAYDAFTTSLANGHGSEPTNLDVCQGMASLAKEAAMMAGSGEGLLLLASRQGIALAVPDGACTRPAETIALATAVEGEAPREAAAIAAPGLIPVAAAPAPVVLAQAFPPSR